MPRGEITCVVGPNGSGKSTLLATISGLLQPRLGTITVRRRAADRQEPRGRSCARGVVHVPQNHSLFTEMTVRENIELGGYLLADRGAGRPAPAREVEEMFPAVAEWARPEGRQPVRRSAAAGRVRQVPDARSPGSSSWTSHRSGWRPRCSRTVFAAIRVMNASGKTILLVEQNARAGPAPGQPRRRARERPGAPDRDRRRRTRQPGDRRALPGRQRTR